MLWPLSLLQATGWIGAPTAQSNQVLYSASHSCTVRYNTPQYCVVLYNFVHSVFTELCSNIFRTALEFNTVGALLGPMSHRGIYEGDPCCRQGT